MRAVNKEDSFDYSSVLDVVVEMEMVNVAAGPLKNGKRRFSLPSKPEDVFCVICVKNITFEPYIRCNECQKITTTLCLLCFRLGAESGGHRRSHNYEIIHRCGPPVFNAVDGEGPSWGAGEEQLLLLYIRMHRWEEWTKAQLSEFGRKRTIEEAKLHLKRCFLQGQLADIVLRKTIRPPIHVFGLREPEIFTGEYFEPMSLCEVKRCVKELQDKLGDLDNDIRDVDCHEAAAVQTFKCPEYFTNEDMDSLICSFSHCHVEHNQLCRDREEIVSCYLGDQFQRQHSTSNPLFHTLSAPDSCPSSPPLHEIQTPNQSPNRYNRMSNGSSPRCRNATRTPSPYKANWPINKFVYPDFMEEEADDDDVFCDGYIAFQQIEQMEDNSEITTPGMSPRYTFRGRGKNSFSSHKSEPNGDHVVPHSPVNGVLVNGKNHEKKIKNGRKRLNKAPLSISPPKKKCGTVHGRGRKPNDQRFGRKKGRISKLKEKTFAFEPPVNGITNGSEDNSKAEESVFNIDSDYFTPEQVLCHRLFHPNLVFTSRHPPILSRAQIKNFDREDLSLIAYNPKRDDFEHEYRNAAELFVSRICMNSDTGVDGDMEHFRNAVRVARVQRYNRILERRHANHSIIREHQLVNEFFNTVKTHVIERGKYPIYGNDLFPSRRLAEELRPYFAKLCRVFSSIELNDMVKVVAEIETTLSRIKVLRALQTSGEKELKGRMNFAIARGRKRKSRKSDVGGLRKAGLRWERIKRWSKKAIAEVA